MIYSSNYSNKAIRTIFAYFLYYNSYKQLSLNTFSSLNIRLILANGGDKAMKKQKRNRNKIMLIGSILIFLFLFFAIFPTNAPAPSLFYYPKYLSQYLSFYSFLPTLFPAAYYLTYIDPTLISSPILTTPTTTVAPTALASGLLFPIPPLPVTPVLPSSFIAPAVADFLINTGNPEVNAVLGLIALNPTLLNDPFLLNSLINTGNPDVASALAIVSILYAP